jgi:hypothetical protein
MKMKYVSLSILAAALSITIAFPHQKVDQKKGVQVIVGYLVDYMCGKHMVMNNVKKSDAKAAKHTIECALDEVCAAKGYGLVTGGKFYKFDASGDKKAAIYLNATKREDNIRVEVLGVMDGDKMSIRSIKDAPEPKKTLNTKS